MSTGPDLGARINRARRRTGLSVARLADQLGLSRSLVSDIVSGKRTPSPAIARALVSVLDLDEATRGDLERITDTSYTSSALDAILRVDSQESGT